MRRSYSIALACWERCVLFKDVFYGENLQRLKVKFALALVFVISSIDFAQAQVVKAHERSEKLEPAQNPSQFPVKLRVKKIVFKGNTVFDDEKLQEVIAPYLDLNRPVYFEQLLQARSAITKFYTDRGYITSGAFLPTSKNQKIQLEDGIFTIQIIEGKLEEIEVSGSPRLTKYIKRRLRKATSPVLNKDRFFDALRLLQLDPLVEGVSARLSQGSKPGQSFLSLKVKTSQPTSINLGADNSGSSRSGRFQRELQLTHTNLLGLGDKLGFRYRNTDGNNIYSGAYTIPVNAKNGTVGISYTNVSTKIIEPPFSRVDIIGDARVYELTFKQPLIQQVNDNSISEFALGITASRKESESSLLDRPYPLSRGADRRGRTRISALRFFQEWSTRGEREVFLARSQFSLGIGAFDATINASKPDSNFFAWKGEAAWNSQIAADTSLLLKTNLQIADRPLVPLEQFGSGGLTTVRGYRQDALLTDNAFVLSAELSIPILTAKASKFYVIPFADFGAAWNNGDFRDNKIAEKQEGVIASLGLGVEYQLGDNFSTRLDWGVPLITVEESWEEKVLYFSVRYKAL